MEHTRTVMPGFSSCLFWGSKLDECLAGTERNCCDSFVASCRLVSLEIMRHTVRKALGISRHTKAKKSELKK